MKPILTIILMISTLVTSAQEKLDCDNISTLGLSYVVPKSLAFNVSYFSEIGIAAGIGAAYTFSDYKEIDVETKKLKSRNTLGIFTYVGYRVFRIDYVVSVFTNVGLYMGNEDKLNPYISTKVLFPNNQRSVGIEPGYVFNRGFTGKITYYIKL